MESESRIKLEPLFKCESQVVECSRPATPQLPAKKRGAGGHGFLFGHLLTMFQNSPKKNTCNRDWKTYRLPCNPAPLVIDCERNGAGAMKKTSDARRRPSKMQNAVLGGFMSTKISAAIVTALCVLGPAANAYDKQLDVHAIHEAYILGQRNDKSTGDFLAPYLTEITEPQNDVHIAQIELLTPFAQIVDVCRQKSADGFTEEQAIEYYKTHGNTVKVNVAMMLPSAYPKTADSREVPTPE